MVVKDNFFEYLRGNSYRSERHKLFYVSTPKVACTSLKWWFAKLENKEQILRTATNGIDSDPELDIHHFFSKIAPEVVRLTAEDISAVLSSSEYFRFAMIRNPYKRLFSAWQSKLLLQEPLQITPYLQCDFYHYPIKSKVDIAMAFEGFLEHLAKNEAPSYWDYHWTPQVTLLRPDLINYSTLVKIEEKEKLVQALATWLGTDIPNPLGYRINESFLPYCSEFLTERSTELIRTLYAEDFDIFGYDKDSPPKTKENFSANQCDIAVKAIQFIRRRHQRLSEYKEQNACLQRTIAVHEEQNAFQEKNTQALLQSRSWRWTKSFRLVAGCVRGGIRSFRIALTRSLERIPIFRKISIRRIRNSPLCIEATIKRLDAAFDFAGRALRALPKAVSYYRGSAGLVLIRTLRVFAREGPSGVLRRIDSLVGSRRAGARPHHLYGLLRVRDRKFFPKVSVIVPNYNHAFHLRRRLDSIYCQTYKNMEVFLLDDCSTDESRVVLTEYADRYPEITTTLFNEKNSGGVFQQWAKGIKAASGDLIWIADSDDYCDANFLDELVRFFANSAVMLAFSETKLIQDSVSKNWTQEQYLADICSGIWQAPFVKSAMDLVRLGWVAKNLLPNVSSALFRNSSGLKLLDDAEWLNLRMCGDWVFYLNVIRGGLVGYSPATTNYYRQRSKNKFVKAQLREHYYREHEVVGRTLLALYPLDSAEFSLQEQILYNHWCIHQGDGKREKFLKLYSQDRIKSLQAGNRRKLNIAIAVYALSAGGGETFPLNLANFLWQRGYAVTVINFQRQPTEDGIRRMLIPSIPIVELSRIEWIGIILNDLGIELVHSHHTFVDVDLATFLTESSVIRHVVTLHGMYETMERNQIDALLPRFEQRVDAFVYTSAKNLSIFSADFRQRKTFVKIKNALPSRPNAKLLRADFGLVDDDFVLCMVARGIPEKGWKEAIVSVILANNYSNRKIQLVLIGTGPEVEKLKRLGQPDFVHFLGFRADVRDCFSVADAGFLPTRFKGESAPLVLIDCLLSGRPMLASSVGEIPVMLGSENGMAGMVFELEEGKINVEQLGKLIADLANDTEKYNALLRRVPSAAAKFDMDVMVDEYENLYHKVMDTACPDFPLVES